MVPVAHIVSFKRCRMFYFATYKVLIGKPDGKRRLGRPRSRGDDNIKIDLKETGWKNFV